MLAGWLAAWLLTVDDVFPGATGHAGRNGITGATGQRGHAGGNGATGGQGRTGATGHPGATGQRGRDGTGTNGATGGTGPAGLGGPRGGTGSTGPRGRDGLDGGVGATGQRGAPGPNNKCIKNECLPNNGGCSQLCIDTYSSYYCSCRPGYRLENPGLMTTCPGVCDNYLADIVFVIDSSGSIRDANPQDGSYDNWNLLLEFMVQIVDRLNIGSNKVRIGAVKFSTDAESVFHMNQYTDKNSLKSAIRGISYLGGHTNTASGIRVMHNTEFTANNGDRVGVQDIAIVITDGVSTRDQSSTIPEAIRARSKGIQIYSVGITKSINEDELRQIASAPHQFDKNYFLAADFQNLERVALAIMSNTCNNLSCLDGPLDLVLILGVWSGVADQSTLRQRWNALVEMAKHILDTVTVSEAFAKVGLVTLGAMAKSVFLLKDGYSKSVLQERIGQLPYDVSQVSPAAAIRYARQLQFTEASGDRQFAPDLLLFLTDEMSVLARADVVNEIRLASVNGIKVYSISSDALNTLDLTASVAADANADQLLSTATQSGSLEHTLATMTCGSDFGERLFCGHVNTKERMCFCRFDNECDVRPANGSRCLDVDECLVRNGGCEQRCENTQGGFRCSCRDGFTLSDDKWSCEDVNECIQRPCGSEACTNTYGSYFCGSPRVGGLVDVGGAVLSASTVTMSTVVTAMVLSAIAAVLVSLLAVLTVRQVQQWRSSRSAPSDHSSFNRPASGFAGFDSVSSKLSAMTWSGNGSVTTEEEA